MTVASAPESVRFDGFVPQVFVARFEQPDSSSDDGAILLRAADERLGSTRAMANALVDRREATKVQHPPRDVHLRRFVDDQRAVPERIADAHAAGGAKGPERAARTLRGLAASLRAGPLADAAEVLETALRGGAPGDRVAAAARVLADEHRALFVVLAQG